MFSHIDIQCFLLLYLMLTSTRKDSSNMLLNKIHKYEFALTIAFVGSHGHSIIITQQMNCIVTKS